MSKNSSLVLPQVEESKIVYDQFIKIRQDRLKLVGKGHYDYYIFMAKASAVVILALTENEQYIINEEYRHPVKKILLCCAGGYIDQGEDPLAAAKRELVEETGYHTDDLALLGTAYPYPGISDQKIYYVLAKKCMKIKSPQPEIAEIFQTILLKKDELNKKIYGGCDLDGTLGTALFFYQLHLNMNC